MLSTDKRSRRTWLTVSWVSEMGTGSIISKAHNGLRTLGRSYGLGQPWKRNRFAGSQRTRQESSRRLWLHLFQARQRGSGLVP